MNAAELETHLTTVRSNRVGKKWWDLDRSAEVSVQLWESSLEVVDRGQA